MVSKVITFFLMAFVSFSTMMAFSGAPTILLVVHVQDNYYCIGFQFDVTTVVILIGADCENLKPC
jgi:hypothetical protein